jgi:hypothetical protein
VTDDRVSAFGRSLDREERLLLDLRDEVYKGSWEGLRLDLQSRLDSKPFVTKLARRIEDDLARIAKLAGFEAEHNIDLKDYVPTQG